MAQTTYRPAKGRDIDAAAITATTVTAAIVGNVTGNVTGALIRNTQTLTATATVTVTNGTLVLNHATVVIAAVIPALSVGEELVIYDGSASGTAAHTATLTSPQTYNAAGNTIATLNAPGECLIVRCIATNVLAILVNTGSVALS